MEDQKNEKKKLVLLRQGGTKYPTCLEDAKLEVFENKWPLNEDAVVKLICPEFTSLCPITSQPDFAKIIIEYCPNKLLVESKSLKIYLFAYRNEGMFHEFVINKIAHDLYAIMQPEWIEVVGKFYPRGGISIHPTVYLDSDCCKVSRIRSTKTSRR